SIADIIFGYGEERYARKIAKGIASYRQRKTIETTGELVEIINQAVPPMYKMGRIHPATRTFQALRIAVNDELNTLKQGIVKGFDRLEKGGRMAVISFHSLEDRIVKHFYKGKEKSGHAKIITKRPITASEDEVRDNPRSRSAKLRIIEKE
ncbi:MAG: 16S rRNA (cytosine(1402)-N(4))-methyltransferase RsmH, partial [bacterium]|nr:16S rRNA (cytosine(1402)-N(4))-methyltransferase RsmH [bacterium]